MIIPMLSMVYPFAVLVIGLLPREFMLKLALFVLTIAFLVQRMLSRPITGLVYAATVRQIVVFLVEYDVKGKCGIADDDAFFHPIATPLTLLIVWAITSAFVESVQDWVIAKIKALVQCVLMGLGSVVGAVFMAVVKALTWVLIAVPSKVAVTVAGVALRVLPARIANPVACVVAFPFNAVAYVATKIQAGTAAIANRLVADVLETANTFVEDLHIPDWVPANVRSFFASDEASAPAPAPEVPGADADVPEAAEVNGVEVNNNSNNAEEEEAAAASVAAAPVVPLQAVEIRQPPQVVELIPPRLPPYPPPPNGGTLLRAGADLQTMTPRGALPAFAVPVGHPTTTTTNNNNNSHHQEALAAYYAACFAASLAAANNNSSRTSENMNGLCFLSGQHAPTTTMAANLAANVDATNGPSASSSSPTIPTTPPTPANGGIGDSVQPPNNNSSNANEATDDDDDVNSFSSSSSSGVLPAGSCIKEQAAAATKTAGNKRKFDVPESVPATDEESSTAATVSTEDEGEKVNEVSEPQPKKARTTYSESSSTAAASAPKTATKMKGPGSSRALPTRSSNPRASAAASKRSSDKAEEGDSNIKKKSPQASAGVATSTKRRGTAAGPAANSTFAPQPAPPKPAPSKRNRAEILAAAKRSYDEQRKSEQIVHGTDVDAQPQPSKKARRT